MTVLRSEIPPAPVQRESPDGTRAVASVAAASVDDALGAVATLDRRDWALALVFAARADDLEATGRGLRAVLPSLPIAGCTSAGIVDRHARVDAAVQITMLGGAFAAEVASAPLHLGSSRRAGEEVARAIEGLTGRDGDDRVLLLLADGLVGDTNDVVRGAYDTVGASVPIVGGCAGDDLAMVATHQLAGDELLTGSVVGVALSSSAPLGIGVRHGWSPVGAPMTVTEAEGTSVIGLDDRPALDAYLEAAGVDGDDLTSAGLAVACQTRPFGLPSGDGYHVRFVRGGDLERRSIEFLVAVPEGELVTLMQGDIDSVIGAAGDAVEQAVASLEAPPLAAIAFDCVACRGVIGEDRLGAEAERVTTHLPPEAVLAGLYTYGEIARRGGAQGFHNQTMVVLAIQ